MLESPIAEPAERPLHENPLLSVRALTSPALFSISFELMAGECLAIVGPSGSGKSLLLRGLADLDPNDGEVRLEGQSRAELPAPQWRRLVTYAAAEPGWWAATVEDHFADWALAAPLAQRLGLIRVLVQSPRVLLLDEPTAALDQTGRAAVEAVVRERLDQGAAALWVTHDQEQAKRVATRCLSIRDGRAEEATL